MAASVPIRRDALTQLTEHVRRQPNRETCGLLAGRDGVITRASPADNVASEPSKNYEISPQEIIRLMKSFRTEGLEFLGIYHSHPNGENKPSARDIELAYYSEEVYFIISPRRGAPKPVRAFSIRDGRATELDIEVI